jgi:hypothetical protein
MRIQLLACFAFVFFGMSAWAHGAAPTATQPRIAGVEGFPITVWLQAPNNAPAYKEIGINTFVGLWEGPTEKQLAALKKAGMKVICDQNEEALKPAWKETIVAFMHGDEPDNAQERADKKGYGPPIPPAKIQEDYKRLKAADPRPVLLNLGQGVAWDGWYGRGERTNKPEDYIDYVKGCDIASFDIYPAVHDNKAVAGKLEFVASGTARLKKWASPRPVWTCIETTRISNEKRKPTVDEVRAEVWMAITSGATGIIYFAHEFKPKFIEAGLLADKEMAAGVKKINAEVQEFSGAIFEGAPDAHVKIETAEKGSVQTLVRTWKGTTYVAIVGMTPAERSVTINLEEQQNVLRLGSRGAVQTNSFEIKKLAGYEVALFKITK